jgi:hypothetical protein
MNYVPESCIVLAGRKQKFYLAKRCEPEMTTSSSWRDSSAVVGVVVVDGEHGIGAETRGQGSILGNSFDRNLRKK